MDDDHEVVGRSSQVVLPQNLPRSRKTLGDLNFYYGPGWGRLDGSKTSTAVFPSDDRRKSRTSAEGAPEADVLAPPSKRTIGINEMIDHGFASGHCMSDDIWREEGKIDTGQRRDSRRHRGARSLPNAISSLDVMGTEVALRLDGDRRSNDPIAPPPPLPASHARGLWFGSLLFVWGALPVAAVAAMRCLHLTPGG
jgi:hypothetical protein